MGHNPFASLSKAGLPESKMSANDAGVARSGGAQSPSGTIRPAQAEAAKVKNRGRVDIRRETGGRAGKTVTVIDGFVGIGLAEKEQLAKKMRGACGCGGTVKDGAIEIQGDQRETIARILTEAGFRPVFAGG